VLIREDTNRRFDDDLAERTKGPLQKIIGTEGMGFNHGPGWHEQRK
jgi:hypothetical protein